MTVTVENYKIEARVAQRLQQGADGVDLWIQLKGVARPAGEVRAAIHRLQTSDERWDVQPTTGGAYVWLLDCVDWAERTRELASELSSIGHAGSISVPAIDPWFDPACEMPFPIATLAHQLERPLAAGPFNDWGVPEPRWGVPESVTERLMSFAANWVLTPPGTVAHVGGLARVPVVTDDAPDIIRPLLVRPLSGLRLASTRRDGEMRRSVGFQAFAETSWVDLDKESGPVAIAQKMAKLLIHFASEAEYGAVHIAFPGTDESSETSGLWRQNRHLWSSFVPDAFGIQLLTGQHLARAHDLSGWRVDKVADDRWIVTDPDLEAWFSSPVPLPVRRREFPHPDLRQRARADFGALIITDEFARANPLTPTPS
ncbi:hypothetical protein [Nocardioides sp. 616]|uniref:hypothetical protein n=1 Tax=Nocardioides sp. 616 TaxID=2268090 RepID=UPI000CE4CBB7|nr:hypothetical protein [Nocardioides sp. 616]